MEVLLLSIDARSGNGGTASVLRRRTDGTVIAPAYDDAVLGDGTVPDQQ